MINVKNNYISDKALQQTYTTYVFLSFVHHRKLSLLSSYMCLHIPYSWLIVSHSKMCPSGVALDQTEFNLPIIRFELLSDIPQQKVHMSIRFLLGESSLWKMIWNYILYLLETLRDCW